MKRLVQADSTKKWVVGLSAEDGQYGQIFEYKEDAAEYIKDQTGKEVDLDESKRNYVSDEFGRKFSAVYVNVGPCDLCGKSGRLYKVQGANLCMNCYEHEECGNVEIKDGKPQYTEEYKKFMKQYS